MKTQAYRNRRVAGVVVRRRVAVGDRTWPVAISVVLAAHQVPQVHQGRGGDGSGQAVPVHCRAATAARVRHRIR